MDNEDDRAVCVGWATLPRRPLIAVLDALAPIQGGPQVLPFALRRMRGVCASAQQGGAFIVKPTTLIVQHETLSFRCPGEGSRSEQAYDQLRASSASTTARAARFPVGTTTSPSSCAATRSSSPNARGMSPPLPDARRKTIRSIERPERHFAHSFATFLLAIARKVQQWLPRCPHCLRRNRSRAPTVFMQ